MNDQVLNQALTPICSAGTGPVGGGGLPSPGGPTTTGRPVAAVAAAGGSSYARFSIPVTAANATPSDTGLVEVVDLNTQRTTATAGALEMTSVIARAGARVNVPGRSMVLDSAGTTAFVLTASGLSVVPLATGSQQNLPQVPGKRCGQYGELSDRGGAGRPDLDLRLEPGIGRDGREFAAADRARRRLRDAEQHAAVAPGDRAHTDQRAAASHAGGRQVPAGGPFADRPGGIGAINVTVAKYAPAVFMDAQGAALYHADGTRVNQDHPGKRDERLTLYATGLGVTTGGRVTRGQSRRHRARWRSPRRSCCISEIR